MQRDMPSYRKENRVIPTEIENGATWREIVISTVIAVFVVLVVNGVLAFSGVSATIGYNLVFRGKWQHIHNPGHSVPDLLVFGDSSGLFGVSTSVLDSVLGVRSWNYATTAGALTLDDAVMLAEFIELHGSPEGVLIVHTYDVWHRHPNRALYANYPVFWQARSQFKGTSAFSTYDVMWIAAMRMLPMAHIRERTAKYARFPWRIQVDTNEQLESLSNRQEHGQNRATISDPSRVVADYAKHLSFNIPAAMSPTDPISAENRAGLNRIAELAHTRNFPVYLANGPILEDLAADPSFSSAFVRIDSALTSFAKAHRQVHYIDLLDRHPLEDMQYSVEHILHTAADRYTARLARAIQFVRDSDNL
jgi:hypothetical protein